MVKILTFGDCGHKLALSENGTKLQLPIFGQQLGISQQSLFSITGGQGTLIIPILIVECKGYITLGVSMDTIKEDINETASFIYPNRYGYFAKGTRVSNN
jgi:hypothetical protein